MKTKEDIYLDEVKRSTEQLGEKFGKIVMSDAIRKFTLNCLMKMEDQFRQPDVIKSLPELADKLSKSIIEHFNSRLREDVMVRPDLNEIVEIAFDMRKCLKD
jgi:hypothetical protein